MRFGGQEMTLRLFFLLLLSLLVASCGTVPVPGKAARATSEPVAGAKKGAKTAAGGAETPGQDGPVTEYTLAKKLYDQGRYRQTIVILENSITGNMEAQVEAKQSEDLLVLTYSTYAGYLIKRSRYSSARSLLIKAQTIQPNNAKLTRQMRLVEGKLGVDRYYEAGLEALRVGAKESAYQSFLKVVEIQPNHKLANEKINELKPEFIDTYYKRAMAAYLKQDLDTAIKGWDKVLELDPNHELSQRYRARAVGLKERLEKFD